jgi:hypothetical protein
MTDYPPRRPSNRELSLLTVAGYWPEPWSSRSLPRSTRRSSRIANGPRPPPSLFPAALARSQVGRCCRSALCGSWAASRPHRVARREDGRTSAIAQCTAVRWGMRSARNRVLRVVTGLVGRAVEVVVGEETRLDTGKATDSVAEYGEFEEFEEFEEMGGGCSR